MHKTFDSTHVIFENSVLTSLLFVPIIKLVTIIIIYME